MASPGWKLQQNEAVNYVDALTRQLEVTKHRATLHQAVTTLFVK